MGFVDSSISPLSTIAPKYTPHSIGFHHPISFDLIRERRKQVENIVCTFQREDRHNEQKVISKKSGIFNIFQIEIFDNTERFCTTDWMMWRRKREWSEQKNAGGILCLLVFFHMYSTMEMSWEIISNPIFHFRKRPNTITVRHPLVQWTDTNSLTKGKLICLGY